MKRLLTLALVIGWVLGAGAAGLCAERAVFRMATAADPETLDPMGQLSVLFWRFAILCMIRLCVGARI